MKLNFLPGEYVEAEALIHCVNIGLLKHRRLFLELLNLNAFINRIIAYIFLGCDAEGFLSNCENLPTSPGLSSQVFWPTKDATYMGQNPFCKLFKKRGLVSFLGIQKL